MFARVSLAAAVLAAACSSPVDEPANPRPARGEGRYGLLVMTHEHGEPGVAVSGQFALWEDQTEAAVLHALALPDMAWLVAGVPAEGECRAVLAPRAPVADGTEGHIELLGAGELTVEPPEPVAAGVLRLQPREFPRVLFSLGGVVYDADAPEALPFVAHGRYRVGAPGDEIGPIQGELAAPGDVRLEGERLDAQGLALRWSGHGPAVITLSRESGGETRGIQCQAPAGGLFVVPAVLLAEFGPGEAQLSVGEITRRRVAVSGLSAMDLFFVSRDQAVVRLAASPAHE